VWLLSRSSSISSGLKCSGIYDVMLMYLVLIAGCVIWEVLTNMQYCFIWTVVLLWCQVY